MAQILRPSLPGPSRKLLPNFLFFFQSFNEVPSYSSGEVVFVARCFKGTGIQHFQETKKNRRVSCNEITKKRTLPMNKSSLKNSSVLEAEMFGMQETSNRPKHNNPLDNNLLVDTDCESLHCFMSSGNQHMLKFSSSLTSQFSTQFWGIWHRRNIINEIAMNNGFHEILIW